MLPRATRTDCYFPTFALPSCLVGGDGLGELLERLFQGAFADIDQGAKRPRRQELTVQPR